MHILVTNDDGVNAPGLLALSQAMRALGKVTVIAPDRNWSASGHVKTLERPLRVKVAILADGSHAMATDGAPSDCVALAVLGLIPEAVDIVVSGINGGENVGHDLTYSGTVTAAMEGAITGLPSVAVSLDVPPTLEGALNYGPAAAIAQKVVANVIANGLPDGILLNVNVPYLPLDEIRGVQVTRQGLRIYKDALVERTDPRGRLYYWIGGEAPGGVPEEGTDIGALNAGYVSVTPVHLDMTAHQAAKQLREWKWG
ncbi:MAG: 5'/3'-nucleotidase SurE [Chloroflexi bacterium]|nr:MAG: 5'/3'-nucleotidase SurE [Chloroflexota bacterium]